MITSKNDKNLTDYISVAKIICVQCAGSAYGNYFNTTRESVELIFDNLDSNCDIKWDYDLENNTLVIHEIIEN